MYMKPKFLLFSGITAIALAVACNTAGDETKNEDSAATEGAAADNTATSSPNVHTTGDGRSYMLRPRKAAASASENEYDTVWVWHDTQGRYYTIGGATGKDTLYYNAEDWNRWWESSETDNELKLKEGNTKVKIDDDGSWKIKDDTSKTKVDESGKVKTKRRDD